MNRQLHLQGTRELDYDDRDNVTEMRWHRPDGALQTRFVQAYDEASRMDECRPGGLVPQ